MLYRTFLCVGDGRNFLDAVPVEVIEGDGGSFLGRQGAQGEVEVLVFKGRIGSSAADERARLVNALHRAATCLVAEEGVVGNLEEPRSEFSLVTIASQGEVGLDEGILCQIIGIALVAAAQGEQEASQGLLLTLHMRYEDFARHWLHLLSHTLLLGLHFLGEHLLAHEIIDKKCDADPEGNQTEAYRNEWVIGTATAHIAKPCA